MAMNGWSPTHQVAVASLPAWAEPDPRQPPKAYIPLGAYVRLAERRGDWGLVDSDTGWSGWVNAGELHDLAGGPLPAPARQAPGPRKSGGCGRGCLVGLFLLALLIALPLAFALRIPHQLGLLPSAEHLLAGTPDREGAAAMVEGLESQGIDTTGMRVYLLPVGNGEGVLAYAVIDFSEGFTFSEGDEEAAFEELFVALAGDAARAAGVTRVAIEYRDEQGRTLGVLTAARSDIDELSSGSISFEEFAAERLDGKVDWGLLMAGDAAQ